MENLNCLRCRFRHEDNGNCTAVGGFCTAVPAAHCPLLREYLNTGLTPELAQETAELAIWIHENGLEKIKEWIKADKEGRLIIATAPTADVAPVVHGRWIRLRWENNNYCCDCSECGGEAMYKDYHWSRNGIYPICTNCGARMYGGDSDAAD